MVENKQRTGFFTISTSTFGQWLDEKKRPTLALLQYKTKSGNF
jgi:hypothetical protein